MQLEQIGFYTLSDDRAKTISEHSPIMRAELIITDKCNFKCLYCRGLKKELQGTQAAKTIESTLDILFSHKLTNVRFSGGEPTLHPDLPRFIELCRKNGVKRIAISTNGSANMDYYERLVELGVNDFSISLDSGCCSVGEKMAGGIPQSWDRASRAIRELSKLTYVTVGMVFNEANLADALDAVKYAQSLNPADIRIISSAQYNDAIPVVANIPLNGGMPILKYRINNYRQNINIRGIGEEDTNKCPLVLDDLAIANDFHFPCIIHMREGGDPVGKMTADFRKERRAWYEAHDTHSDSICKQNCLDVCRDFNNKVRDCRCL